MTTPALLLAAAFAASAPLPQDVPRWERQAQNVTISRDDWGIPHVYGKTDADAVFGLMYAQAEDDFNGVETNYLNSMGRLAEAEGESAIYQDLRMKLFINPDSIRAQYAVNPEWLKRLMNAWADGLNFYLSTHPEVKPRVITRFEPWMALTFSEGSISGDIERINPRDLQAIYGDGTAVPPPVGTGEGDAFESDPTGSNGFAIASSASPATSCSRSTTRGRAFPSPSRRRAGVLSPPSVPAPTPGPRDGTGRAATASWPSWSSATACGPRP